MARSRRQAGCEKLAHLAKQSLTVNRLGKKGSSFEGFNAPQDLRAGIAGNKQNFEVFLKISECMRQLNSTHGVHGDVTDQKSDRGCMLPINSDGVEAVAGCQ